ncbi:MAG: hypothetical protein OJF51_002890 [Nitrospira sp.]|jgi:4-alpha-glucanotransferase|nr:MAG: hypothetical protein OJF51_002890 [Nitrospira sp.]
MLQRNEVVEGIYLKQITERYGTPAGLIAVVHKVGTDWTGEWSFQLRYLSQPAGTRTKPVSQWSQNIREKDLGDFELIGTWLSVQALLVSPPPDKKKKGSKLPANLPSRHPAWMRKWPPNQLRLFEDF